MVQDPSPTPQRAVIVVPSSGAFDSRTHRLASSLAGRGHGVTVLARPGPGLPAVEDRPDGYRIIRLEGRVERAGRPVSSGLRRGALRRALDAALGVRAQRHAARAAVSQADLIHAMAFMGIPIGLDLGRRLGAPVIYDARDLYLEARNLARAPGPARWLVGGMERRWARSADRVATVNDALADEMVRRWGIARPLVVMNCATPRGTDAPPVSRFAERLGLAPDTRVVLYQGGLSPGRGIEQLMVAVGQVERSALVVLGYGALEDDLRAAAARPEHRGRVFVLGPVPADRLIDQVAGADLVAVPIQPTTLNHRLATPNKLFEAMAAGVPVVASDLPAMAPIVRATGCGLLCDPTDPTSIAASIRAILDAPPDERATYCAAGLAAANGAYGWPAQFARLLDGYGRLTGQPW
jgi:glycosyltransferase involved in cell wall biosynthesis